MPDKETTGNAHATVLYITYDGLTDPLGQSQVLPYLTRLSKLGHRIIVLSCEKPEALRLEGAAIRTLCAEAGIEWRPLRYHKIPPVLSSVFDMLMLQHAAVRLHLELAVDVVHCRSYIPAAAGLRLKRRFSVPLLFDMRGFWPEEKIEGGSWNLGNPLFRLVNRYFKRLESRLLAESDAIISLTDAGKAELLKRTELRRESDRVTVVPCCVDIDHFELAAPVVRQSIRGELGIAEEAAVLAYLGSLGGNYLLGEMLDFFRTYSRRHPGARFLFITREDAGPIRAEADRHGIRNEGLVIRPARREEVPRLLAAADLGIAFKQPSFSALGCSPTKMGEMMAVGLPIIANAGVGDVAEILARTRAGVTVSHFDEAAYARALDELDRGHAREQRRQTAVACFDIALGVERYDRIYRHLSATVGKRQAHR